MPKKLHVVALIPARYQASRFPGKLLKDLGGKPVLARTYEAVVNSQLFDEVYVVYFKTNTRRVMDSPNLLNYCREIYQMAGVKETVNMEQIKTHYFCSHPVLNTYSIIPRGVDFEKLLAEPHNRDSL